MNDSYFDFGDFPSTQPRNPSGPRLPRLTFDWRSNAWPRDPIGRLLAVPKGPPQIHMLGRSSGVCMTSTPRPRSARPTCSTPPEAFSGSRRGSSAQELNSIWHSRISRISRSARAPVLNYFPMQSVATELDAKVANFLNRMATICPLSDKRSKRLVEAL